MMRHRSTIEMVDIDRKPNAPSKPVLEVTVQSVVYGLGVWRVNRR